MSLKGYKRDDTIDPSFLATIAQIAKQNNIEATKALKELYIALGGQESDIEACTTTVSVLNEISALYDGADNATNNLEAIKNITEIAGDIGGKGKVAPKKDVNFYDYDGTIVKSYTAQEFTALTAMPSNPSHDGLTAQGWNWSFTDAKAYVAKYDKLNIGQMYITSDGKTRLYIELTEGRLSPWLKLYLNENSELDIDWGDDSEHSTFTSTTADYKNEQHTYTSAGSYVIAITVINGGFSIQSSNSSVSALLTNNDTEGYSPNRGYAASIRKIEIGNNVTEIGYCALRYCHSLSLITIPNSITNIGDYAFEQCSLISITIPNSITVIGNKAFQSCRSLSSVTIPNSIKSMSNTFVNCCSLNSITIPDTVTGLWGPFDSCYSLNSITIPNSVTSIGAYTFKFCYSLNSITIPDSVITIDTLVFSGCYSLRSITIPDSVTKISDSVFASCYSLSSIMIPDSVTSIGSKTFSDCYSLDSITINKPEGSITGSPWGAKTTAPISTKIIWTG